MELFEVVFPAAAIKKPMLISISSQMYSWRGSDEDSIGLRCQITFRLQQPKVIILLFFNIASKYKV